MKTLRVFAAAAALGIGLVASPAHAAGGENDTVVMSGLDNPRGLTFDHGRRALYVAEAGSGGNLRCVPLRGTVCVGKTGAVSRYWHGRQRRIVEGLPSYSPFATGLTSGSIGPSDVSFSHGQGYVVIGLAANPDFRTELGEPFGWIARFRPNGNVSYDIDVSGYEKQANPAAPSRATRRACWPAPGSVWSSMPRGTACCA